MAEAPLYQQIASNVKLGKGVRIFAFTNLYGCQIGDDVKIGTFVEIQKGADHRPPLQNLQPHVYL